MPPTATNKVWFAGQRGKQKKATQKKKRRETVLALLLYFGGEPEGSLGGLEWREPSFLTMLCSCYLSDDETFALGDGGLKG